MPPRNRRRSPVFTYVPPMTWYNIFNNVSVDQYINIIMRLRPIQTHYYLTQALDYSQRMYRRARDAGRRDDMNGYSYARRQLYEALDRFTLSVRRRALLLPAPHQYTEDRLERVPREDRAYE